MNLAAMVTKLAAQIHLSVGWEFLSISLYSHVHSNYIVYHCKNYSVKTNQGVVSAFSVSPFSKIYMFHHVLYIGI